MNQISTLSTIAPESVLNYIQAVIRSFSSILGLRSSCGLITVPRGRSEMWETRMVQDDIISHSTIERLSIQRNAALSLRCSFRW